MKRHLFQCQLLDLLAVIRTGNRIVSSHSRIFGLNLYSLSRVDAHVDNLVGNPDSVKLRRRCCRLTKREITIVTKLDRVKNIDAFQADILKIEHRVLGIRDLSFYRELIIVTRGNR